MKPRLCSTCRKRPAAKPATYGSSKSLLCAHCHALVHQAYGIPRSCAFRPAPDPASTEGAFDLEGS